MTIPCKGCGEDISIINPSYLALSRYGYGKICSDCGTREALQGNFISKKDPYLPEFIER